MIVLVTSNLVWWVSGNHTLISNYSKFIIERKERGFFYQNNRTKTISLSRVYFLFLLNTSLRYDMFVEDRRTAKTQTHPFSTLSHIYTIHRTEHQTQRESRQRTFPPNKCYFLFLINSFYLYNYYMLLLYYIITWIRNYFFKKNSISILVSSFFPYSRISYILAPKNNWTWKCKNLLQWTKPRLICRRRQLD